MAIADKLTTLNTIKTNIKTAINGKGGSVGDDFTTYATAITNLPSGGGSQDLQDLIEKDITSINIPAGTTTIGNGIFWNCTVLASVTIPNSVTSIGQSAFSNCCSLTSIVIPNSVTSIGIRAFDTCSNLTSVTIGNSVTSIGQNAFNSCGRLTSIVIPNSVTSIDISAFQNCNSLTSVTIGNSVTSIGRSVFQGCTSLSSITSLNTTPPTLQSSIFQNVPANCAIYVPAASVDAYKAANYWSSRASYIMPIVEPIVIEYTTDSANQQVTITNNQALFNSITIDGTPQTIGTGALTHTFASAGVHEVSFKLVNNTGISGSAFNNCYDITSVSLPDSITTIGYEVFYGCSNMTALTLPSSLVTIGDYAFADCASLTSFTIPSTVTTIGQYAFMSFQLSSFEIPDSVTTIGDGAFYGNIYLKSITCNAVIPPTLGTDVFYDVPEYSPIIVPSASLSAYKSASGWSDRVIKTATSLMVLYTTDTPYQYVKITDDDSYFTSVIIDGTSESLVGGELNYTFDTEGVHIVDFELVDDTEIGAGAFQSCSEITGVIMPDTITTIGTSAFDSCSGIETFTIPNTVTSIGDYAFAACSSLYLIDIPNSVTTIGEYAFSDCALTDVIIPNSVTSIGMDAFYNNPLGSVDIGNSVTSIGDTAFGDCSSLFDIISRNTTPPTIYSDTFQNVPYDTTIEVPDSSVSAYQSASGWSDRAAYIIAIPE